MHLFREGLELADTGMVTAGEVNLVEDKYPGNWPMGKEPVL
jgi:hypothetical protein